MILSGSTVRTENVQLLAGMLDGDELAVKLERAVANKNTIVGLSLDDRRRITAVLAEDAPWGLAQLQSVLVKQLKQHKDREAQDLRVRLNRERALRQREPLTSQVTPSEVGTTLAALGPEPKPVRPPTRPPERLRVRAVARTYPARAPCSLVRYRP